MATTYKGKRASYYIHRSRICKTAAGTYELFFGNNIILKRTSREELKIIGPDGTKAILDGLSTRAWLVLRQKEARCWALYHGGE